MVVLVLVRYPIYRSIAILVNVRYRYLVVSRYFDISNESMISQTILGRYTSIEYRMKYRVPYRMIRFLIPKAGFILRMQIYAVYRNTQTILRTWGAFSRSPMPIYAVGIAQMPSINTPTIRVHTRRDLRRGINAITRVSA